MSSRRASWVEEFFRIQLNNPNGVVHAGRVLSGKLCVNLRSPLGNGLIKMVVSGKGWTSWKEADESSKGKTIRFTDEEVFLHQPVSFWDGEIREKSAKHRLEPGMHTFPFEIQIPPGCPSSYEGKHGHIQYVCRAILTKPFKMDHEIVAPFTVIGSADLNSLGPQLFQPVTERRTGKEKNGVRCQLSLARTAFVPGEVIAIFARIHNDSKDTVVGGVRAILRQKMTFRGRSKGGATKEKLKEFMVEEVCKREQLEPGGSQEWANEGIKVPSTPPSMSRQNCIISISYELEFAVSSSIRITLPIFIGSLPHRDHVSSLDAERSQQPDRRPANQRQSVWEMMQNIPPPAYEECVMESQRSFSSEAGRSGEGESSVGGGHVNYRPRYPNYSMRQTSFNEVTSTS